MRCHLCGAALEPQTTDLPFKIGPKTIVILKELPVLQCETCGEYLLADQVVARIDEILARIEPEAELEILRYAA
jgi:YgiT-type zinc finger domain-containing protein